MDVRVHIRHRHGQDLQCRAARDDLRGATGEARGEEFGNRLGAAVIWLATWSPASSCVTAAGDSDHLGLSDRGVAAIIGAGLVVEHLAAEPDWRYRMHFLSSRGFIHGSR